MEKTYRGKTNAFIRAIALFDSKTPNHNPYNLSNRLFTFIVQPCFLLYTSFIYLC